MLHISLKTEKSFIAHPWRLLCVVGLEEYSAHDWRAATLQLLGESGACDFDHGELTLGHNSAFILPWTVSSKRGHPELTDPDFFFMSSNENYFILGQRIFNW